MQVFENILLTEYLNLLIAQRKHEQVRQAADDALFLDLAEEQVELRLAPFLFVCPQTHLIDELQEAVAAPREHIDIRDDICRSQAKELVDDCFWQDADEVVDALYIVYKGSHALQGVEGPPQVHSALGEEVFVEAVVLLEFVYVPDGFEVHVVLWLAVEPDFEQAALQWGDDPAQVVRDEDEPRVCAEVFDDPAQALLCVVCEVVALVEDDCLVLADALGVCLDFIADYADAPFIACVELQDVFGGDQVGEGRLAAARRSVQKEVLVGRGGEEGFYVWGAKELVVGSGPKFFSPEHRA